MADLDLKAALKELKADLEDSDTGGQVPYDRFRKLTLRLRDLESSYEQLQKAENESLTKLQKDLEKANKELQTVSSERDALSKEKTSWAEEKAFIGAGLTDAEGYDVARLFYGKLDEKGRPELGEWLKDREKLPAAVKAYLPAEQGQTGQQTQQQTGRVPNSNAGVTNYNRAPAAVTPSANPQEYAGQRDAIFGGNAPTYSFLPKKS